MSIDTSGFALPKGTPRLVLERAQKRAEEREWARTKDRVDARDERVCQVTGRHLQVGADDPWQRLERHHLEYRSRNKGRRWTEWNVWTVSAGVHALIHSRKLRVLNPFGEPAKDVREITRVEWNRAKVAIGEEPCEIRRA